MNKKIIIFLMTLFLFSCDSNIKEHDYKEDTSVLTENIVEKKEEIKEEIKEKGIFQYIEVIKEGDKEKYISKILNRELKIDDILRYKYKRIIEDIDPNINLTDVNVEEFNISEDGIYLGNDKEVFLEYDKFIRIFKANIGFNSIYKGEKLEPKKREILANKKYVAFTYDDGPGNKYHDMIREIFNDIDMSATFYVVGARVKEHPEKLLKTYLDGHEIANHSYNHPDLRKLTPFQIWKEFGRTNDEIFKVIGVEPEYIRPPYGAVNKKVREELNNKIALWDVDTEDWKSRNVESIVNMVLSNVKDGSVVLFHDLYKESYEATKILVPILLEQGYQFITFSQMEELKTRKN